MNDRDKCSDHPLDPTVLPETPTAALDAGLAAAFAEDGSIELRSNHKSVLKSLGRSLSHVPRVVLRTATGEGSSPIVRPRSKQIPAADELDSRYRIDGEIARGGMGAILKGRDTDLGRDLAIKVLLDSHKDKPAVVERFVEEAQIGGQLQHPGIVPVYELGQFDDQRPFFSMKLVKGKTLSALLAERNSPIDDRARFLGIFEQICQTMAYAHSRAVIHRDLKPANIMVGAFGEVQVMDWGLAKVLGEGGVADEIKAISFQKGTSIIETIRSHGSDTPGVAGSQTQLGSVLGTPAYMSPEQALGEVDRLDERADVFGLGAILCEILTGKPPYVSDDGTEVYRMATRGKLEGCFERLIDSGADEELIGLVRVCLELEPTDRPRDAGVVSLRLTAYLESVEQRLRQAELDRIEANTRAIEEGKRRRVSLALAVSVILTLVIAGGGWIWGQHKQSQLAQAETEAENESIRQKEKLNGLVRSELTTARALGGDLSAETPTDPKLLARALESIRRAESLLKSGEVDPLLVTQLSELRAALESRERDEILIAELEKVWEWEMEQLAEQAAAIREVSNSYVRPVADALSLSSDGRPPSAAINIPGLSEAAGKYATIFDNWGVVPEVTPKANAVANLKALAPTKRATVLVSLDRWSRALTALRTMEQWSRSSWVILEPMELVSRGGDKLDVLDDKSILASGDHPEYGFDLVFETDQNTISALRLETFLHDSLPRSGPGRGADGSFHYWGLRVSVAPQSSPDQKQPLRFRSAVADYASSNITIFGWSTFRRGGKPHVAVFDAVQPVHSESGFRVTIGVNDKHGSDNWNKRALGRFRWSVCSDSSEPTIQWLSDVVASVDDDPWRRSMRSEIANGDIDALLRRASERNALAPQSQIAKVELAEILKNADLVQDSSLIPTGINWEVLEPLSAETSGGTKLQLQDDGSVFASGPYPRSETYIIAGRVSDRSVSAIRLETVPDKRLPLGGYGRNANVTHISEISVELAPAARPTDGKTVTISRAFASHHNSEDASILKAIDGNDATSWKISGQKTRMGIFVLPSASRPSSETQLTVQLTFMGRASLGRFRILVTHDEIAIPDPNNAGIELLRHMHGQDPGNYWVNLSLSQALARQAPPQFDESLRFATAAVALRPNSSSPHYTLASQIIKSAIHFGRPVPEAATRHLQRSRELSDDESTFPLLVYEVIEHGKRFVHEGEFARAISYFRVAEKIDPNSVDTLLWLAWTLVNAEDESLREPASAAALAKRALDIQQENAIAWGILGSAQYRDDHFSDARKSLEKAYESLNENDPWLWFYMAMTAEKLGEKDKANEFFTKSIEWVDAGGTANEWFKQLRAEAESVLGITGGTSLDQQPAQSEQEHSQDQ